MSSSGTGEWPGDAAAAPAVGVVEPALGELLTRLRLARPGLANREGLLTPDDRAIFAAGIEARRAVLQNTLALVLAQWTFYRVAIRNLPRPARAVYGATQVVVAGQFVRFRARKVDVDLFAQIVNQPEDSPMGNEARIVLADLEGPDGPYYRSVVNAELRTRIVERFAGDPAADTDDPRRHPQRMLRPRLLQQEGRDATTVSTAAQSPHGRDPTDRERDRDSYFELESERERERDRSRIVVRSVGRKAAVQDTQANGRGGEDKSHTVGPFDFAAAAVAGTKTGADASAAHAAANGSGAPISANGADPVYRRGAERRERRRRARESYEQRFGSGQGNGL